MAQWNPPPPGPGEFRVPGVPSTAFQRADGSWVAPLAELPPGVVAQRGIVLKRSRPAADEPVEAPFAKRSTASRPPPPPFQPWLEPQPSFDEWAHHRWSTGATYGDADQAPEAVVGAPAAAPAAGALPAPTLAADPEGPSLRANRYVTTNGYY